MEGLIVLSIITGMLAVLGMLANRFGADSRPAYTDDWARSGAR